MSNFSDIKIIDNSNYIPKIDTLYLVLGMLCEYRGRAVYENTDFVECFFVNELSLARLFVKHLNSLKEENCISSSIELRVSETGSSQVISREMAQFINEIYPYDFQAGGILKDQNNQNLRYAYTRICETMFPAIKPPTWHQNLPGIDPRYSYLYGAYLREGQTDEILFRISNASHKVELIKQFLEDLEAEWVSHKIYLRGAPQVHEIKFGSRNRLQQFLTYAQNEKRNAM